MVINKQAVCGTLQSNDCFVRINPGEGEGIMLHIESTVKETFGKQIEETIMKKLEDMGVESCSLYIEDKGALDYTIRARVETAVKRADE